MTLLGASSLARCTALVFVLAAPLLFHVCAPRDPSPSLASLRTFKQGDPALQRFKDHNVIFVSFDALQAAHVGCLGYPRDVTPTIDKLASQAYIFTRAYSVASWTVPASMTWFTGVYPSEHRMTNKYTEYTAMARKPARLKDVAPNLTTIAEIFKQNGYITGGFTGNAGVSGEFGYAQGFDVYYHDKGTFGGFSRSVPRALDWLKANKDRKFFLFLHGYDVHGQYEPSERYDYRFVDRDYDQRFTGAPLEQEILREEGLEKGQLSLREEDVRFWRAIYDEKLQRADARFAQFLAEVEKLGLGEKTLFVLTSDHGTELYEHRRFDHGFTLYSELIHVPLIVKLPRQTKALTIHQNLSSIDLMPTLIDLLELNVSEKVRTQMRGESLVSIMQGSAVPRLVFAETDYREYTFKRAILSPDNWKFILTLENNQHELYDLKSDPGERNNLASVEPGRVDELKQALYHHFESIGCDLTARRWIPGLNPVYDSQAR